MIWIIGANGLIGSETAKLLTEKKLSWIGSDTDEKLMNQQDMENFIQEKETENYYLSHRDSKNPDDGKISWIINCASLSNFKECEENPELAEEINSKLALNIARTARSHSAKLIHISTSYVFDGKNEKSYSENDEKNPTGIYGKTKARGEENVLSSTTQCYVIRTSKIFGSKQDSFLPQLIKILNQNSEINAIDNSYENFTSAKDFANIICTFIEKSSQAKSLFGKNSAPSYGIYNFSNGNSASSFDFLNEVNEVGKHAGLITGSCKINAVKKNTAEENLYCPENLILNTHLIEKTLKIKIPGWKESLKKLLYSKEL